MPLSRTSRYDRTIMLRIAPNYLSRVPSLQSQAWPGGFIAGVLRYLFVLATGARELPPSPIGPAGRWVAKIAALVSVVALAASLGNGAATDGDQEYHGDASASIWRNLEGAGMQQGGTEGSSPLLCAVGVAVLCASFSVDFFQIWILLPRAAAAACRGNNGGVTSRDAEPTTKGNPGDGGVQGGEEATHPPAVVTVGRAQRGAGCGSTNGVCKVAGGTSAEGTPYRS